MSEPGKVVRSMRKSGISFADGSDCPKGQARLIRRIGIDNRTRLTGYQVQLLQSLSIGGLSHTAMRRGKGYGAGQIRTLRDLCVIGFVVETQSVRGIRFELTDVGRSVIEDR
jgi:hypothetical protein